MTTPTHLRLASDDEQPDEGRQLLVTALHGISHQYVALADLIDATVSDRVENLKLLNMVSMAHFANSRILAHLGESTLPPLTDEQADTLLAAIGRHPSGSVDG